MSEKIINALWTQSKNGYRYDKLLQSVLSHEPELTKSADLFPAAIVILSMAKNNIVEANHTTAEHLKLVLTDLAETYKQMVDVDHSGETSSDPYFMELLNSSNPNCCIDLVQQGIAYLTERALGPMYSDICPQYELPIPYDLFCSVYDELGQKDALSLSLTCKKFYVNLGSTLDIHSWKFESIEDGEKFKIADELIRRTNRKLPDPKKSVVDFEKEMEENADVARTEFFVHLVTSCVDLYLYLRKNPQLINEQDQYQKTLLHYAAHCIDYKQAILTQHLLFSVPGIDLHIKDDRGDTPFHLALLCLEKDEASFQYFANEAVFRGFDWSTKGNGGETILHRAVLHEESRYSSRRLSTMLEVMDKHKMPNRQSNLDALSDRGETAFYICVAYKCQSAAEILLNAGANLEACGEDGTHNPLKRMAEDKVDSKKNKTHEQWEREKGALEKMLGDKLTPYIESAERKLPETGDNCNIL